MDTDSAYMALSDSLANVIRPDMRLQFWTEYGDWFPRPFCPAHKTKFIATKMAEYEGGAAWTPSQCCQDILLYDKRTPGLFKVEFEGVGMIALNSKTYYCWDKDDISKYSSKGISKSNNQFCKDNFLDVLRDGTSCKGVNKGFVYKDGDMYTYNQSRTGLTYLYAKRRVLADGVSTENIDV